MNARAERGENVRKRKFISERITNISELERILERERILIETLSKELDKELPDMKKVKEISSGLSALHKKASSFEFCLEQRKVKKKDRTF